MQKLHSRHTPRTSLRTSVRLSLLQVAPLLCFASSELFIKQTSRSFTTEAEFFDKFPFVYKILIDIPYINCYNVLRDNIKSIKNPAEKIISKIFSEIRNLLHIISVFINKRAIMSINLGHQRRSVQCFNYAFPLTHGFKTQTQRRVL